MSKTVSRRLTCGALKELECENKELRRAIEILKLASAFFAQARDIPSRPRQ